MCGGNIKSVDKENHIKTCTKGEIYLYVPVPTSGSLGLPKLQCLYPKKHLDAAFVSGIQPVSNSQGKDREALYLAVV